MLVMTGTLMVAMGLFAGTVLVAAPFGLTQIEVGLGLWLLFPSLLVIGYLLIATGTRDNRLRIPLAILSALLLLLALAAAAGLVLNASGVVNLAGDTLPLWYVLMLAGMVGVVGAATGQKIQEA